MALNAKFYADFSSFYTAVNTATSKLDTFQKEAEAAGVSLNRMGKSLSGEKVIADAMSLVAAVEQLGGVSTLTAAELDKVGRKAAEAVEKAKKLGIEAPEELKNLADAADKTWLSFDGGLQSIMAWGAGLLTVTAAIDLAKAGFSALVGFLADSVTAAAEAEASQARLHSAMAAAGVAVPAVEAAYKGYIEALKLTTVHSGDALEASAALLTTVGNVMPRDMEAALTATTNLAQAFDGDLTAATNALAQAARGSTAQLEKHGIKLDDSKVKAEGFSYILGEVNSQMAGAGADAAATYGGRLAQLSNAWGDLQERVGDAIVQNQTVLDLLDEITRSLQGTSDEFEANADVMNLVSDAVILMVRSFSLFISGLGAASGFIKGIARDLHGFVELAIKANDILLRAMSASPFNAAQAAVLKSVRAELLGLSDSLSKTVGYMSDAGMAADRLSEYADGLSGRLEVNRGKTREAAVATGQLSDALNLGTENVAANEAALKGQAAAADRAAKAAEKAAEAEKKLADSIAALEGPMTRFETGLEVTTASISELDRWYAFNQAVTDLEGAGVKAGVGLSTVGTQVSDVGDQFDTGKDETKKFEDSLNQLGNALGNVGNTLGDSAGAVFQWTASVVTAMKAAKQSGQSMQAGFQTLTASGDQSFSQLAQGASSMASGALGAVSAIDAATNSASTSMNVLGGVAAGAQAGMAFGPWGAAVGAAAGAVVGFAKSARDGRNAVTEFVNASGGAEVMRAKLAELGDEGERLWVALTQGVDASDLEGAQAAIAAIQGAFGDQTASVEALNSAIERYGFSIEELGPAFQRQELDKQAAQLYKDYNILIAAGVKNTTVTKKMADEVNKYVKQATKMGVEVPSAMRPMLENMAKMGLLTDSSGKKVKDLEKSGIKFSMSMSEGFEGVIASVDSLTNVLAASLGVELKRTKDRVEDIPDTIDIKVKYQDKGFTPKGGTTTVKGYQGGTKGFEDFGAGTLVMLHGREAVVPESAVKTAGASGAAALGGGTTVIVNAQGSFFDTPGDLQRLADKVNAALTAKHGLRNRTRAA